MKKITFFPDKSADSRPLMEKWTIIVLHQPYQASTRMSDKKNPGHRKMTGNISV